MDFFSDNNISGAYNKSCIILRRNVKNFPFPAMINAEQFESLYKRIIEVLTDKLPNFEFQAEYRDNVIVLFSAKNDAYIYLNDEDHIRVEVIKKGDNLAKAYEIADLIDNVLDSNFKIAFNKNLGYLTANAKYLGTGLTAIICLNLNSFCSNEDIAKIRQTISKIGMTCSMNKDGSFNVINNMTMGISEKQVVQNLMLIANQIVFNI